MLNKKFLQSHETLKKENKKRIARLRAVKLSIQLNHFNITKTYVQ